MIRLPRHLLLSLLVAAFLGAACGGGSDERAAEAPTAEAVTSDADTNPDSVRSQPDEGDGSTASGSGDCSVLSVDDVSEFSFVAQLLAQVVRPDQVEALGPDVIGYSPDDTAELLARMHTALDGRPADGFDDPREAIAFYEDLNERLRALLAAAPVSQDMVDDYVAASGGLAEAIGRQLPIGAAISAHCPELT